MINIKTKQTTFGVGEMMLEDHKPQWLGVGGGIN